MAFLNFLRVGSRGHMVSSGQGGAFDIPPGRRPGGVGRLPGGRARGHQQRRLRVRRGRTRDPGATIAGMRIVYDSIGIFPTAVG